MAETIEIHAEIVRRCARKILEDADEDGSFHRSFSVGDAEAEIDCTLLHSPFPQDRRAVTGVQVRYARIETRTRDGDCLSAGLTARELEPYLKS